MDTPYPLPSTSPYSLGEIKSLFEAAGATYAQWADANGFDRQAVYLVTQGRVKGRRGKAHEIAVRLGLKLSVEKIHP